MYNKMSQYNEVTSSTPADHFTNLLNKKSQYNEKSRYNEPSAADQSFRYIEIPLYLAASFITLTFKKTLDWNMACFDTDCGSRGLFCCSPHNLPSMSALAHFIFAEWQPDKHSIKKQRSTTTISSRVNILDYVLIFFRMCEFSWFNMWNHDWRGRRGTNSSFFSLPLLHRPTTTPTSFPPPLPSFHDSWLLRPFASVAAMTRKG